MASSLPLFSLWEKMYMVFTVNFSDSQRQPTTPAEKCAPSSRNHLSLQWNTFLFKKWFKKYFWCGPFLKSIEFVTTLLLFYGLAFWLWSMWEFSSLTRDWTHTPCIRWWSPNCWTAREVPKMYFFNSENSLPCPALYTHTQSRWLSLTLASL